MGHQLQPLSGAQHCARPKRGHFGGSKGDAARQGVRNVVSSLRPYSNPTSASALVNLWSRTSSLSSLGFNSPSVIQGYLCPSWRGSNDIMQVLLTLSNVF